MIRSNNGKLTYECVGDLFDGGGWLCVFGLDLYGWADLGDTKHIKSRGCVGSYVVPDLLVPASATKATQFRLLVRKNDPLDPFGRQAAA